jgi:hypothetical protein
MHESDDSEKSHINIHQVEQQPHLTDSNGVVKKGFLKKRPSNTALNIMTALVGIFTLLAGIGWLVYTYMVDMDVPYFAIPLIMCIPVIVAVAFRNMWD